MGGVGEVISSMPSAQFCGAKALAERNSPVRASIAGKTLDEVFVLPRQALRDINRIYLVDRDEPAIIRTTIEPIWSTAEVIVVKEGLKAGQWLSTTRLPYAPDGAPVQVVESTSAATTDSETPES